MVDTALKLAKCSKEFRDKYVDRTDVLDKVKELSLLPIVDCVHTAQVCEYFDIKPITLRNIYKKAEEEFKSDGVVKLDGTELGKFKSELYYNYQQELKARASLIMYPKRAVLRVAMMLDKSPVAKEIQSQLFGSEESLSIKSYKLDTDVPSKPKKQRKSQKKTLNNIDKILEENNKNLIRKFESMLNNQQEIIINNLTKVWYKLDETKKQREIVIDDIDMIKFDIAKIIQSMSQSTDEEAKHINGHSKPL